MSSWPPAILDEVITDLRQAAPEVHAADHADERQAVNAIISALGGIGMLGGEATLEARLATFASALLEALGHSDIAMRPTRVPAVGGWFGPPAQTGTTTPNLGTAHLASLMVPEDIWFDAYRYEVTTAGTAGAKAKAMIMTDVNGAPGPRHWFGAQTAGDAVATVETVISPVFLPAGHYWAGLVAQQQSGGIYRSVGTVGAAQVIEAVSTLATTIVGYAVTIGTTTQDPPTTTPVSNASGGVPRVIFRRCAPP